MNIQPQSTDNTLPEKNKFGPSEALIALANARKNIPLQYDAERGVYYRDINNLKNKDAKKET